MKRILDVVLVFLALPLLALPLLAIALLVRCKLGGPVFYRQVRAGLNSKPIEVVKFRTMTNARGADGELLTDQERITPFGWALRRTSLDELPQLWCVLKGDMSLVGPRPLPMAYVPLYSPEQARRQLVRPGITGLAQVSGRNSLSWEDKFRYDVIYVDNQSIWMDMKILLSTVKIVLGRQDIGAEGEVSARVFTGSGQPIQGMGTEGGAARRP